MFPFIEVNYSTQIHSLNFEAVLTHRYHESLCPKKVTRNLRYSYIVYKKGAFETDFYCVSTPRQCNKERQRRSTDFHARY
jgi:hypothetical protein